MSLFFLWGKFVTYFHVVFCLWKIQIGRTWVVVTTLKGVRRFMKVFISGSKGTARYYRHRMPCPIREKLDNLMEEDAEIIIGDCWGIDADVQKYLNDNGYQSVTVYVAGGKRPARNNEGNWEEKHFDVSCFTGYSMRAEKDIHMAEEADMGLAIWDEESKGTFVNMVCILAQGKPCEVFSLKQQKWLEIMSVSDLEEYVSPEDEQPDEVVAEIFGTCGFSEEMREYQLRQREVTYYKLIEVICQAPIPLVKKKELLKVLGKRIDLKREILQTVRFIQRSKGNWNSLKKEIRFRLNGKCRYSTWSEYQAAWKELNEALNDINSDPLVDSIFYLFSEWYDTDVFFEKSYGDGLFFDRKSAEAFMLAENAADEMKDDTDEAPERTGEGWYRLECWNLTDPKWERDRYDYYYYDGEICWFERLIPEQQDQGNTYYTPESRRFTSGETDLNLSTPYRPGDIVFIDCRPFGPPFHAMILEARDQYDCCFPRIIFRIPYTDKWTEQALIHRMLYKDAEIGNYRPMLSPLYRIRKVRDDEMTPEDEKLLIFSRIINKDEEKAEAVYEAWNKMNDGSEMTTEEVETVFRNLTIQNK